MTRHAIRASSGKQGGKDRTGKAQVGGATIRLRAQRAPGFGNQMRSSPVNRQNPTTHLAPLRPWWDAAPVADGQLSWKAMEDRRHRMDASGYIARREVPHGP